MENALFAALGWFFGLVSAIVLERNRTHNTVRSLRKALAYELAEIANRLTLVVYTVAARLGTVDAGLLTWLAERCDGYRGPNRNEQTVASMKKLAANPTQAIADLEAQRVATPSRKPILAKCPSPALEIAAGSVADFPSAEQEQLLEIRTLLALYDSVIDDSREFFRMTFEEGLSEPSRIAVETNLNRSYQQALHLSRRIVDLAQSFAHDAT